MKVLESSATRYDKGIKIISFGKINKIYDQISNYITPGCKVLDIGCGTGAISLRVAQKGADVTGIDINPEMISICKEKADKLGLQENLTLIEKGVAELTTTQDKTYDFLTCGLSLSELSYDELKYAFREAHRLLKDSGKLIIIDEVVPKNIFKRILHQFIRIPTIIIAYILTQTTTHAIKNLPEKLELHNFKIETEQYIFLGSMTFIVSSKE